MSDNLVSYIAEASKIWIPISSLGRKDFSIDLTIEVDGKMLSLVIGRPFLGIDERAWGLTRENKIDEFPRASFFYIDIRNVFLSVSRIQIDYTIPNEFLSIDEIIFKGRDESVFKIFGDIDTFEVPCINNQLTLQ